MYHQTDEVLMKFRQEQLSQGSERPQELHYDNQYVPGRSSRDSVKAGRAAA
jgi:hypothetical protein